MDFNEPDFPHFCLQGGKQSIHMIMFPFHSVSLPISLLCLVIFSLWIALQDTGPQQMLPHGPWKAAITSGMLPPSVFTFLSTALLQIPLKCTPYSFSLSNFSLSCPIQEVGFREFSFSVLPSSPWKGCLLLYCFIICLVSAGNWFFPKLSAFAWHFVLLESGTKNPPQEEECQWNILLHVL